MPDPNMREFSRFLFWLDNIRYADTTRESGV
jgi:hypothetical protein